MKLEIGVFFKRGAFEKMVTEEGWEELGDFKDIVDYTKNFELMPISNNGLLALSKRIANIICSKMPEDFVIEHVSEKILNTCVKYTVVLL